MTKNNQDQVKIAILRSGVILDVQFKNEVYSLLKNESPFDEILKELESGRVEVKRNNEKYKMKKGILVVHREDQDDEVDYWRTVIPDSTSVKNFVVTEMCSRLPLLAR